MINPQSFAQWIATPDPFPQWYVARIGGRVEAIAQRAAEAGIATYSPISRLFAKPPAPGARRRAINAPAVIERPLMPGYLFVELDAAAPRFGLFAADGLSGAPGSPTAPIHGCRGFLMSDGAPARVAPAVIDDMRAREARGEFDLTGKWGKVVVPRWVKKDAVVNFTDGPFLGQVGRISKMLSKFLVDVWVQLFGTTTLVSTPIEWLSAG